MVIRHWKSDALSLKTIDVQMQINSYTFFSFQYWEKAKFPFHVIPKLGALRITGGTIKVFAFFFPFPFELLDVVNGMFS